jgi:hypothetical protein
LRVRLDFIAVIWSWEFKFLNELLGHVVIIVLAAMDKN